MCRLGPTPLAVTVTRGGSTASPDGTGIANDGAGAIRSGRVVSFGGR